MTSTNSVMPAGYTFLNSKTFISKNTEEILKDLLKKADNRDPNVHGLHIYNDFFNYATLDLIDKSLSSIHTKIVKENWEGAFVHLEALTIFMDMESNWPMCDDGKRVMITNKVYGASVVTVLRKLQAEERLDLTHFPSLETFLSRTAEWGSMMKSLGGGDYHLVCKGIGERLFGNKSDEMVALEKARFQEWLESLDKEDQAAVQEAMEEDDEDDEDEDEDEDEDDEEVKPWYDGGREDDEDDDYVLSRVWKEYKEYLQECPTKPLKGPPNWDLTKWTYAEKHSFTLDRHWSDE